ncbi:MAG: alpha/beta hydrolase [Pseudomonadota bacterium]
MIIRLTQTIFGALCRHRPQLAANIGYWLFRRPSAFNFKTPEEQRLLKDAQPILEAAESRIVSTPGGDAFLYHWGQEESPGQPAILLLHGWGGEAGSMAKFVEPLRQRGFRVLAPDLPGHGKSGSKDVDTLNSLKSILEITTQFGPVQAIVGHSLGSLLACFAVKGHSHIGGRVEAERLALVSGPVSLASVIDGLGAAAGLSAEVIGAIRSRADADLSGLLHEADTRQLLDQIDLPVIAYHDREDPFVGFKTSLVANAGHARLKASATEGLGHIDILADEAVITAVADFSASAD